MPLALACAVLIWVLPKAGLSEPQIAGLFAAGLAGGLGLACLTGLAGIAKVPAEGDRAGLQQAIFLALGVALSITLARQLPSAHALWVVDIFVIRAITPSHLAISKAWRYAIGTLIGVALVLGLEHSGLLTAQSMHITAALTLVIGLRLLPVGPPWPTAFFTIAVLFSLAPTPDDALFRSEAALLAAGLAILLRVLLNQLLRVPENRAQAIDP